MKRIFISILVCLSYYTIYGQAGSFYVQIPDKINVPEVKTLKSSSSLKLSMQNEEISKVFQKYEIKKFEKAFPTAVTPFLQEIYIVESFDLELMKELNTKFTSSYPLVEEIIEPIALYEPNDLGSNGGYTSEQTNLELMQMPLAWDITKGHEDLIVGITDTDFDLTHPELDEKIVEIRGSNTYGSYSHGTVVASVLSAETDNNTGISGTAFNCPILASSNWASDNEMLQIAQSGIRVINASWINRCSFSSIQEAVYNEIRNLNNCIVVAGAGNNPSHCGSNSAYVYPASYDNVISVSSVGHYQPRGSDSLEGWEDCHENIIGDTTSTHHHNDRVNICAPGYRIPVAEHTSEGSYGLAWGTSVAAPQVAGVCALIISVNPCLNADEVVDILYSTADDLDNIPENARYQGLLGVGRVNVYKAVLEAVESGRVLNVSSIHSGNNTVTAPTILSAAGRVTSGSDITFQAPREVELRAGFEVELGAEFEIVMDYTCPF